MEDRVSVVSKMESRFWVTQFFAQKQHFGECVPVLEENVCMSVGLQEKGDFGGVRLQVGRGNFGYLRNWQEIL